MRVARHRGKGQTASPAAPPLVREAAPNHRHISGERNVFPHRRPHGCAHTLPSGMRSGPSPVRAPWPPLLQGRDRGSAASGCPLPRRPPSLRSPAVEINERLFRAARPSCERCPVISGERGREERLSADSSARPRLRRSCSQVPERGQRGPGWLSAPPGRAVPRSVGLIAWQASSAVRHGPGRCD